MPQQTRTVIFEFTRDSDDLPSLVTVKVTRGHPGCTSGPPDAWRPPDPDEAEIVCGKLDDGAVLSAEDYTGQMSPRELRELEDAALEAADEAEQSSREEEPDLEDFDGSDCLD